MVMCPEQKWLGVANNTCFLPLKSPDHLLIGAFLCPNFINEYLGSNRLIGVICLGLIKMRLDISCTYPLEVVLYIFLIGPNYQPFFERALFSQNDFHCPKAFGGYYCDEYI